VTAALELKGVSASYGRFRALSGVSLRVASGSALAIIGPNGAGKSTIARVATGLVPITSGRIYVSGGDVTGRHPYEIARLGVAHLPEGRSVFASLSVEDNLLLAFGRGTRRRESRAAMDHAFDQFPRLHDRRYQIAGTLSGGEQRMLALARVLAVPPALLIVDELSLGLAPRVVAEVMETLSLIRESGTALLMIEQQVQRAAMVCEEVAVLRKGTVTWTGPIAELETSGRKHGVVIPAASS
jgi:branched-chain amino acid transport system ATP-binding protein